MKKYLADILTLIRFVLAISLFVLCFASGSRAAAFMFFVLGELTDAFDGTLAQKYPFPKNKTPKYRKYAAKYDMVTDALLSLAMALFFILRVNLIAGLIILFGYGILALVTEFIVYGKLFGHPDDVRPGSLALKNFPRAKKIILARRNLYLALMFTASAWTLYASEWPLAVKIALTAIASTISLILWFYLSQRRHNISRDAVEIEKKLTENSRQRRDRRA